MSFFGAPLRFVGMIKKVPGSSCSILMECDDGQYYIAKLWPQRGANTLRNEAVGAYLFDGLDIPAPPSRMLALTENDVRRIGNYDPMPTQYTTKAQPGLHFASEFPVADPGCYVWNGDVISASRITDSDRAAIYLFDLWAEHRDHRQFIHTKDLDNSKTKTLFIDNGHLFRGNGATFRQREDLSYMGVRRPERWNQELTSRIAQFKRIIPTLLDEVLEQIPPYWYKEHPELFRLHLLHRLMNLSKIVEEDFAGRIFNPPPTQWGVFCPTFGLDRWTSGL